MHRSFALFVFAALSAGGGAAIAERVPDAPTVEQRPYKVTAPFGATRIDPYYWLRDDSRTDPEILAGLEAENEYTDRVMAPLAPLKASILQEISGRVAPEDSSVPYIKNGYYYRERFEPGQDYPVVARWAEASPEREEIMLDQPKMAAGSGFFEIGDYQVSPDNKLLAYAEDKVGRRQFTLKVRDLETGQDLDDNVGNIEAGLIWSGDSRRIFYIDKDPVTLLSKRVKMHILGSDAATDKLVYEEADDSFYMELQKTADGRFICIFMRSTVSNEARCAPSDNPEEFAVIAERERGFQYDVDHIGDHWVIRTNWGASNYKLVRVSDDNMAGGRDNWKDVVPASDDVFIQAYRPFDGFIAIEERQGGNKRLRLLTDAGADMVVASDEAAYVMALSVNEEADSKWVRYSYSSMVTPPTIYEINADTGERRVMKVQSVPGYDPGKYATERVWAEARDGSLIPVSLVYLKSYRKDGTAPLFQYAYGAYGESSDPEFDLTVPSLVDRGFVYAIAHIRGGQEMGRKWYDEGHLLTKKNSFTDFIDVTRHLVRNGYAARDKTAAYGLSAGGLLMGGVANMAPEDYNVIIAQVPFVDAVTTMLDASIPLTTNEYDEWGNPEQKEYYDYILDYSPYDNVRPQNYPALYVTTGLWDSQVQYYEPAKWVAKLRATKTDHNPLLFRVNMEGGHDGQSGRLRIYEEAAEFMALVVSRMDMGK